MEQVVEGVDPVHRPARPVAGLGEVSAQGRRPVAAAFFDERPEPRLQGQDGAFELDQFAFEWVDLLHVRAPVGGEDAPLQPFHVVLDVPGDLQIEIYHVPADCVPDGPRPFHQQGPLLLQLVSHGGQPSGGSVPDGDDEAVAQEDHDVAGVDRLRCCGQFGVPDVLRGARDQQVDVALAFHDRPVTVAQGLLDGQGVQAEGPGDRHHHLGAGSCSPSQMNASRRRRAAA